MKRVVIIEDQPDLRMVEEIILKYDYIIVAPTFFDADTLMSDTLWEGVDVAVVDMLLGLEVSGVDVLRYLGTNYPDVRRLLVTGAAAIPEEARGLADAVLVKPFDPSHLRHIIEGGAW